MQRRAVTSCQAACAAGAPAGDTLASQRRVYAALGQAAGACAVYSRLSSRGTTTAAAAVSRLAAGSEADLGEESALCVATSAGGGSAMITGATGTTGAAAGARATSLAAGAGAGTTGGGGETAGGGGETAGGGGKTGGGGGEALGACAGAWVGWTVRWWEDAELCHRKVSVCPQPASQHRLQQGPTAAADDGPFALT